MGPKEARNSLTQSSIRFQINMYCPGWLRFDMVLMKHKLRVIYIYFKTSPIGECTGPAKVLPRVTSRL